MNRYPVGPSWTDRRRGLEILPVEEARLDVLHILSNYPGEVRGVLHALRSGNIDGSLYVGSCVCLIGTIANLRGERYQEVLRVQPPSLGRGLLPLSPAERWFANIQKGETPENSDYAALTETWILDWLTAHPEVS